MKSLYFNTKLVGSQLHNPKKLNNFSFYPLMYPREDGSLSQLEILIGVIESFKSLTFNNAILNIEIDSISEKNKENLLKIINDNINCVEKVYINFSRPSNKNSWCDNVSYFIKETGDESPFIVVMNHDHPYVDYLESALDLAINNVFDCAENYKKVMYYSHAPEIISKSFNKGDVKKIGTLLGGVYEHRGINDWLDSICVMTLKTLLHVFSKAKVDDDSYMGRFDWEGVYYQKLNLKGYSYCREFFRHYDGYGHVTGMRIDTQMTTPPFRLSFPSSDNLNKVSDFYYSRWVDCYFLAIRDRLRRRIYNKKPLFVKVISLTLEEFISSYVDQDCRNGLFSEKDLNKVKSLLTSRVYYNANAIYNEVTVDNDLLGVSFKKDFAKLLPYKYRVKIKHLMLKFHK